MHDGIEIFPILRLALCIADRPMVEEDCRALTRRVVLAVEHDAKNARDEVGGCK